MVVSPQAIHRIEKDGKARPATIQKLAEVFKVDRKLLTKVEELVIKGVKA